MQSFLIAVFCGYLACIILVLDFFIERGWHRWIIALIVLCVFSYLTFAVVLHADPFSIVAFEMEDRSILLSINNESDEDYHNLDFTIRTNSADIIIISCEQNSNLEDVTIFRSFPGTFSEAGDAAVISADSNGSTIVRSSFQRIYCEKLPQHSSLSLVLKLSKNSLAPLSVQMQFLGKFQKRVFKEYVSPVMNN